METVTFCNIRLKFDSKITTNINISHPEIYFQDKLMLNKIISYKTKNIALKNQLLSKIVNYLSIFFIYLSTKNLKM